jgi:hypothetical protein
VRCVELLENCRKSRSVEIGGGACAVRWQGMQVVYMSGAGGCAVTWEGRQMAFVAAAGGCAVRWQGTQVVTVSTDAAHYLAA